MATLNNIIKHVEDFCEDHQQINNFFSGKTWNFQTYTNLYPAVIMVPTNSTIMDGKITYRFNIFVADKLNKDRSNLDEILSDTSLIIGDIIQEFHDNFDDYDMFLADEDVTIEPFEEEFDDIVAGWVALNIGFDVKYSKLQYCQIPKTLESIDESENTPAYPNLIENGDFEDTPVLDGITPPPEWSYDIGKTVDTITYLTAGNQYEGTRSLSMKGVYDSRNATNYYKIKQTVTGLEIGSTYKLSGYLYTAIGTPTIGISIIEAETAGVDIRSNADSWDYQEVTFIASAETETINIYSPRVFNTHYFGYFDEIILKKQDV